MVCKLQTLVAELFSSQQDVISLADMTLASNSSRKVSSMMLLLTPMKMALKLKKGGSIGAWTGSPNKNEFGLISCKDTTLAPNSTLLCCRGEDCPSSYKQITGLSQSM